MEVPNYFSVICICLGTKVAHFTHHSLRVTVPIVFSMSSNLRLAQRILAPIFCSCNKHRIPLVVNGNSVKAGQVSEMESWWGEFCPRWSYSLKKSLHYAFFHCVQYVICILTYRQMAYKDCFISQDECIISLPHQKTNSLPFQLFFTETPSPRPSAQIDIQRTNWIKWK